MSNTDAIADPARESSAAIAAANGETGESASGSGDNTVVVSRTKPLEKDLYASPSNEPKPDPQAGDRFGRYVILDRLGQGGMGVVFGAYDSELDRRVALKLLRQGGRLAEGVSEGRARLVREAKAMAKLSHPNVVAVHDVGTHDGRVFVAMEFVEGTTLTKWARKRTRTWAEVRDIFVQAGRGLSAAHAVGIVHRDFKPDNVLVGRSNTDGQWRVLVTDFGLARASESVDQATGGSITSEAPRAGRCCDDVTQPGQVMGTPPYMAPEQDPGVPADHRMDQFSYCVALYEALYGRRPFRGLTRQHLREQVEAGNVQPVKGRNVPLWMHNVVVAGLSAKPQDRWASMESLVDALERRPRRRRAMLAIGAGGIAASSLLVIAAVDQGRAECDGADSAVGSVWNIERKATIEASLTGSGRTHSGETWSRVERSLDDYADDWTLMRTEACESTASGEQSADLMDLRMACLDRRLEAADALVQTLSVADEQLADGATWAAATLPAVEDCDRVDVLTNEIHPPADPEEAAALVKLRSELARVGIMARVGSPEATLPALAEAVERSRTIGGGVLTAQALQLMGVAQERAGDRHGARDSLSESALLAAASEQHKVAAASATSMMGVVGGEDYKQGLLWGWYAEAAVDRIGLGGPDEAAMLEGLGGVFAAHGKLAEARDHLERAVELRGSLGGADDPALASALAQLAGVYEKSGDLDLAHETYVKAIDSAERAFGAQHPELIPLLESAAEAGEAIGQLGPAKAFNARAEALVESYGSRPGHSRHSAP